MATSYAPKFTVFELGRMRRIDLISLFVRFNAVQGAICDFDTLTNETLISILLNNYLDVS
jgi:hypothetical protein